MNDEYIPKYADQIRRDVKQIAELSRRIGELDGIVKNGARDRDDLTAGELREFNAKCEQLDTLIRKF